MRETQRENQRETRQETQQETHRDDAGKKPCQESGGHTRRQVLLTGGKTVLTAGVGAGAVVETLGLFHPPPSHAVDWGALLRKKKSAGGFGVVRTLEGEAFAAGNSLRVGSRVESGEPVRVSPGGRLILNMSDRSVFQFTGPANLELILNMMREGIINLLQGALLAIIPLGNRYLAAGPSTAVGIKGTVFFQEVYSRERPQIQTMEGPMRAPKRATEYFCNCNGVVEYQHKKTGVPFHENRAEHHRPFFIDPNLPGRLIDAPMANHSDEEILGLIALQEGQKHDATWIERYRRGLRR